MRSLVVAVALVSSACGDVLKVPDAAIADAHVPDSPMMLTCASGEMACNNTCVNVMTSDLACGSCSTQCTPTQGCLNGSCVDKASRCSSIRLWNPQATDGVYFNPNTGTEMYCDFTNNITWDEFKIARYDAPPSGFTLARAADFTNAQFQKAFIGMFNELKGVRASYTFSAGNCCVTTIAGQRLQFAGLYSFLGAGAGNVGCSFAYNQGQVYTLSTNQSSNFQDNLPANYFAANPPSETTGCSDSTNPAIYYKRHFGLN